MQTRVQSSPCSPAGIQGSARLPPSKFILYTVYLYLYKVGLYPRISSFTTLKSWISRSVLGTTDEIALLPTLGIKTASRMRQNCIEITRNDDILPDLQTSRVYRRSSGFPEKSRRLRRRLVGRVQQATCHAIPSLRISANQLFQPHPSISPTSTSYFYFCAYLPTNCAGHQHPAHSLQLFLVDFFQTGSSDIGPSQVSQTLWADGWGDRLSLVENTTTLQLRTSKHFSPQTFLTRSSEMNIAPTILGLYILQGGTG